MKTIYHSLKIFTALFFLLLSACSKDFLETEPPTEVMETFFTSEEKAELAVVGCYDVMGWFEDDAIPFFFGDIIGRDSWKGGDVGSDQDWMDNLINFNYTADNYMLDKHWRYCYIGINRCNTALENIDKMPAENIATSKKNLFEAEIKFVRAYYYFELTTTFGKVPLVDHVLKPSEYQQPLSDESVIWKFIEKNLTEAAQYLPTRSAAGANWYGRATKGAADALRAKAYIYQKKWQEAKDLTDKIIASGEYNLLPNYEDVFKKSNEHNSEIIFDIEFKSSDDANGYGNEVEGNSIGVYLTPRDHPFAGLGGYGFDCPNANFAAEFETGDPRKEATLIHDGETLWPGTNDADTYDLSWPTNKDHYGIQKYSIPKSQQPASPYDCGKNWIVIRYADVLLWNAEAAYKVGANWQSPLQKVRNRVGLGTSPYVSEPLKAIYHERRVELGMEGHRFWDIVRQDRGEEVLGKYGFIKGVNEHFPLPQAQQDLSNLW